MCLPASSSTADVTGYYVSETNIAPARLGSKPGPFFWSKSSYPLTNPPKTPPIQHQLAKLEKVPINRESSRYRTSPVATKAFRTCRIVALEPRMKTGPMTDFVGTEEDLPKKKHIPQQVFSSASLCLQRQVPYPHIKVDGRKDLIGNPSQQRIWFRNHFGHLLSIQNQNSFVQSHFGREVSWGPYRAEPVAMSSPNQQSSLWHHQVVIMLLCGQQWPTGNLITNLAANL